MRPPRFRFPDEVRSATRTLAARMVQDGGIARTPDELAARIAAEPDIREVMDDGGYGVEFTADDVFPLLHVFIVQAGGPDISAPGSPPASGQRRLVPIIIAAVVLVIVIIFAARAFSQSPPPSAQVSGPSPASVMDRAER